MNGTSTKNVTIPIGDFAGSACDASGFHREAAAAQLPEVLGVAIDGDVSIIFAKVLTARELAKLAELVWSHNAATAAEAEARAALREAVDLRLADLQDFRAAASKTADQLASEAGAAKDAIDGAADEAAARAIAETYTRRKL